MKFLPKSNYEKWAFVSMAKLAGILFCFYLLLELTLLNDYSLSVWIQQSREKKNITAKNEKLSEDSVKLAETIEKLKNDPVYLENYARANYTMLKEGETVYKFKTEE
ncbi:MAG: septum formation initiator family protein [Candidatus Cloacimonetes bacterium]|nr:septum formation initiator family protein [Candidatus Cloacimonadota bacterium]